MKSYEPDALLLEKIGVPSRVTTTVIESSPDASLISQVKFWSCPSFSLFCDPGFDRTVAAAERRQAHDPAASTAQWTAIDRDATDLAVVVPAERPASDT